MGELTDATSISLRDNRRFAYFLMGRSVSMMGSAMTPIALTFSVLDQNRGAAALGYVLAAQMIPMLALTLIGGGVADRAKRSSVLMWSNSLAGLTQIAIASVLFTHVGVLWIVPLACLNGAADAFTMPALRGALTELVAAEQLTRANSLINTARNIAQIGGPTVAGLIVATTSGGVALVLDAATFLFAAWAMSRLGLGAVTPRGGTTLLADLRGGWHYFSASPWLWVNTVAFTIINIVQSGVWQLLGPIMTRPHLGANGWGFVSSAKAVGLLLVSVYLVKYARARKLAPALVVMSVAAVPLLALGLCPRLPVLMVTALAAGSASAYFGIVWETAMQTKVSGDLLSRVSSYDDLGAFLGIPLARLGAVPLAGMLGYPRLAVIGGAVYFFAALAPLTVKSVRST